MAKNKKIVRYRKPFHLNIGVIIFGVIFIYMNFYVYTYFTTVHTSVYEVVQGTISVNSSYTGLALRSEEIFPANQTGSLNYYVKDFSKVGAGDLICSIDETGDISSQINQANEDSGLLDKSSLAAIQTEISDYTNSYSPISYYNVYTFKNDLNAALSEALSMNALNQISDAVQAAEGKATFHKITAPKPGVAVYYTDGFEDINAENFTAKMFDEASYKKNNLKERDKVSKDEALYKLVTSENWEIVLPANEETLSMLTDSRNVRVKFSKDNTIVRSSFEQIEREGKQYLILSFHNSMIRFASDRYIELELLLNNRSGLKIPNSAITKKDFFTIPKACFQKGDNSGKDGLVVQKTNKKGKTYTEFITPTIYYASEDFYYVDGETISKGETVIKPDSSETYIVGDTDKLMGVYNINKGYAVFKQIDRIYQNEEYSIIQSGTDYGVSLYDHIALDGSTVKENDLVNE